MISKSFGKFLPYFQLILKVKYTCIGPLFFRDRGKSREKKRNLKFATEFHGINQFVAYISGENKN